MNSFSRATVVVALSAFLVAGCAEPREATKVAAATGGAIGAGLGAILGNQTGSTGGGLAIGALAGAATGAAIGNALDAQKQALQTQDEAIERQQATMTAQRAEIEELRRISQDSISYRSPSGRASFKPRDVNTGSTVRRAVPAPVASRGTIVEADIAPMVASGGTRAVEPPLPATVTAKPAPAPVAVTPLIVDRGATNTAALNSDECTRAAAEAARAERAAESADKLFHLRRALRLCPDHPRFHNDLGEVYIALNRTQDAEFEFNEALRLDGSHTAARENLARLVR